LLIAVCVLGCGKAGTGDLSRDTMLEFSHDSLNVRRLMSEQVRLDPGLSQPSGMRQSASIS
jgi:hypothetical protein